jgi:hypothetical protein
MLQFPAYAIHDVVAVFWHSVLSLSRVASFRILPVVGRPGAGTHLAEVQRENCLA